MSNFQKITTLWGPKSRRGKSRSEGDLDDLSGYHLRAIKEAGKVLFRRRGSRLLLRPHFMTTWQMYLPFLTL